MSVQCPRIFNSTIPQSLVTTQTVDLVRTDTSQRTPGTVVNVSCYTSRVLRDATTGRELTTAEEKKYTCQTNGQWDKTLPVCGQPTSTTNNTTNTQLTDQELIVIGVVAAVCGLVLILVIVMLCACWYKRRREAEKRPASEFSENTGEFDRYKPYSMYSPFPGVYREGTIDRRPQYYSASLPRSVVPESFPRPSHLNAYELTSRSAVIRTKPYSGYAGPKVYKASSDTYEDYLAERNVYNYGGRDNEAFRGEWNDRFDRKNFSDFNRDALDRGRDPFLWDTRH